MKYSQALKDEAVQCALKHGITYSAKVTGVNRNTIVLQLSLYRKRNGVPLNPNYCRPGSEERYKRRLAAVNLALVWAKTGINRSYYAAFLAAGTRFGINGLTLYKEWHNGLYQGRRPMAQQPSTSSSTSGDSIRAATSQAQPCTEQCGASGSIGRPPRIVRRRTSTSETLPASMRNGH